MAAQPAILKQAKMSVNFTKSYIKWIVNKGGSNARYALEALLKISARGSVDKWALGAPVLAGNMYHEDGIIKQPLYQFQIAAGSDKNVIYRNKMFSGDDCGSRLTLNEEIFKELKVEINETSARQILDYQGLEKAYHQNSLLSGVVTIADKCELEFPIKVINLDPLLRKFHVETGPVLFPMDIEQLAAGNAAPSVCWIHFTSLKAAEILAYQFPESKANWFGNSSARKIRKIDCEIAIHEIDSN